MNTLYLKYAVEVEKTGSISQAAENLFMAQPNLSKAIKELESDLGISIFERSSRGVHLTHKGREFLNYAENILAQLDKMEALSKGSEPDTLNFSVSLPHDSCITNAAARFLSSVSDKVNDAQVCEMNTVQTIAGVSSGSFELGIIRYKIPFEDYFLDLLAEKKLETIQLWNFEEVVVFSAKNSLADKKAITEQELEGLTEIVFIDSDMPYPNIGKKQIHREARKKITVCERGSGLELLSEIPETFMRSTPLPQKILERYGLSRFKCGGEVYAYRLIFRKGYKLSENDKLFIENLYAAKNETEI